MTLKELFIKRNDRMNDFRLNYYATVLVVSGYLAVAGTYFVLPIAILSYLNLRNYSTTFANEILSNNYLCVTSIDESGNIKDETSSISPEKIMEIETFLIENEIVLSRKLTAMMNLELIIIGLAILYRVGILI